MSSSQRFRDRFRLSLEQRLFMMALMAGFPAALVSLILLWKGDYTSKVQWTLMVVILGFWWGFAYALRGRIVIPLQTLSNLLAALREGDYSIRARGSKHEESLGEVILEVNTLGETLREQRLGALEATTLLRTVMAEIDVSIFAFDERQRLKLVNRAGERLLAQSAERLLDHTAEELGLADCLQGEDIQTRQKSFPGGEGRWGIRRNAIREKGLPNQLLVISDLSRALREEERQAWQRLVRVLGHEMNNSLAPIKSMAGTLESMVLRDPLPQDWQEDMRRGLSVIGSRAEALNRFMGSYARLARLPPPKFSPMPVSPWIRRVVGLETRLSVTLQPGPEMTIQADSDQLEQLMINLVRNAVDASLETGGGVQVGWKKKGNYVEVWVIDEGPGLSNTANLFVPFFTTKPGGSGIGLVLSRQIAEAHDGSLTLRNSPTGRGCEARLLLRR